MRSPQGNIKESPFGGKTFSLCSIFVTGLKVEGKRGLSLSVNRLSMQCGADHTPIVSVALLLVKYMRIASVIGYGVLLSGTTVSIWFLYAK
jgi:hypothetical protein